MAAKVVSAGQVARSYHYNINPSAEARGNNPNTSAKQCGIEPELWRQPTRIGAPAKPELSRQPEIRLNCASQIRLASHHITSHHNNMQSLLLQ